ncbi:MAG: hypothetical protein GWP06_04840 [Actinobacteria bacterium]|nr:hypothetical protein [Actinomycetota bacterium]
MNKLKATLIKATVLTFEQLSFLLPTEELDEKQQNARPEAAVSVEFQGPFSGKLLLILYGQLLSNIAANMLGQEDAPSKKQQQDAFGEIANVICGNMLPGIAGSKEVFQIFAPQWIRNAGSAAAGKETSAAEARVGLDLGRVDVRLFLSSDAVHFLKEHEQ